MLSRLLFVRLRAAENALRGGRLDDAYRIAGAPDARADGRAAELLRRLGLKYIERAREHFAADRFAEALADLDRATACGADEPRVIELRTQIETVADAVVHEARDRRERVDRARRRLARGSLAAGRQLLASADGSDAEAARIRRDIEMRDHEAADIFAEVEKLLGTEQWSAAAERLSKARTMDPHDARGAQLETELCRLVLDRARASLEAGRVERTGDELACLGAMGRELPARRELEDLVRLVREAGGALERHDYDGARQAAMRLQRLVPKAKWVAEVVKGLRTVDELMTGLRASPLGGWGQQAPAVPRDEPSAADWRQAPATAETIALPPSSRRRPLPERILLLVDGGGNYLLLRRDRVSIGRAVSSRPADVPLFADLEDRHANIARVEEDYFLFCTQEAEVGGRRTQHHLLRDGDRVVLGRKAKFTFRLPSRKSPSAVLDLSETSKLPQSVRRVLLFGRNATIGNGRGFHIPCRLASQPLVLFERADGLWLRPQGRGTGSGEAVRLEMGAPVELDGVSLVAQPWPGRSGGAAGMRG